MRMLTLYVAIWIILRLQISHHQSNERHSSFDIESVRLDEARRRLRLLGDLVNSEYDYRTFRERSTETLISMPMLKQWHDAYRTSGLGGLQPDWEPLDEFQLNKVTQVATYKQPML